MEAKELDNKIWAVIQETCKANEIQPACVSKLDRALFQAGIREVVDWIDANNAIMVIKDDGATMFLYVGNEWQAKLKEWGITPD